MLALEAHPKLGRDLVKRARMGRLPQVQVVPRALSDRIAAAMNPDGSAFVRDSLPNLMQAHETRSAP